MGHKRVNFNMASECHALLKSYCAIKRISVSDHCYDLIAKDFYEACREDEQIRNLLISDDYPANSKADCLKRQILRELEIQEED
tara:strand:- start:177 stop:428 length:252 start_codon:yes stop_codon:yes gene_type:complete